ncbi:MAG: hypothetical protein DHS20C21_10230 [Gemmatimonadota bacterium]|nr:MAG: hypothetical protein DHS20C21_10230 [Gemmatimonadota bacterium]
MAAFFPAVGNDYAMDDIRQVARLAPPASLADWIALPAQPWWPVDHENFVWRPLARVTIAAQRAWSGEASAPFYVFNLAVYAIVAGLLTILARQLGRSPLAAAATGLIFAAHPLHAEAVHQIVGRTELLAAAFLLGGLILWIRGESGGGGRGPRARGANWWPQALCFAAALASKEHAVLYPAFLALLMLDAPSLRARPVAERWRRLPALGGRTLGILAVLLLLFLGAKGAVTGGLLESGRAVPFAENPLATRSFLERLPAVLGLFGYAAGHFVWPLGLSPDYSANSLPIDRGVSWVWTWIGFSGLVGLLVAGIRSARAGGRGWALIAAGLGAFALTSNGPFPIGVLAAERLWFWPSAAACLGVGWLMDRGLGPAPSAMRSRVSGAILAAAVLGLLAGSWHYAPAWRSPYDLAHWTLNRFPDNWRSHVNLARHYSDARQYESGRRHGRAAVRIDPRHHLSWQAVGLNAMFLGDGSREAEDAFRRALSLDPRQMEVHRYLANVLEMRGDGASAAGELELYLAWPGARDRAVLEARRQRLRAAHPGPGGEPR